MPNPQTLLHGRRILLVEDDGMVAALLQDFLIRLGCVALGPAARVAEALEILDSTPLDAALLDFNLNGRNSDPVADALAARGLPFVFLTGYDAVAGRHAGRPMVQKPFNREVLERSLAGLFQE